MAAPCATRAWTARRTCSWWQPRKLVHCARVKTPPWRQARAIHSARRPVQPKASSAFSRPRRWSIMLLRPFWSSSPEPPRSTVTSASPSLRGRQGFPTSYVTLRSRHLAVSNTESEEVSQEFRLSPRAGPSPANGSSTCSRRAPSNPKDGLDRERARRGLSALVHAPSHARIPAERHDRLELTRWPDEHLTSCRLVQRLSRVWVASVGQVQMRHRHNESIALHGGIVI